MGGTLAGGSIRILWDADDAAEVTISGGTASWTVNGSAVTFPYTLSSSTTFETGQSGTYTVSVEHHGYEIAGTPDGTREVELRFGESVVFAPTVDGGSGGVSQNLMSKLTETFARPATQVPGTRAPMSKWYGKLAQVQAQTADAKAVFIGASGTTGVFNGATMETSFPTFIKRRLALGAPVANGLAIAQATVSLDPRWTKGDYAYSDGSGPAGAAWYGSTAAGADLTFTTDDSVDTIDVWCRHGSGRGTIAVKIDGGAVASINCATGSGWVKTTYSVAAGVHTIAFPKPTVGDVYILGVDAYMSTRKSIRVANWGVPGSSTGTWTNATGGLDSLSSITTYAPDLSVICLGINDASGSVPAATYNTRLTTIVDKCLESGDAIIVSPCQVADDNPSRQTYLASYIAEMEAVAAAKDVPFIDVHDLLGKWDASLWADSVHLNAKGLAKSARIIWDGLLRS